MTESRLVHTSVLAVQLSNLRGRQRKVVNVKVLVRVPVFFCFVCSVFVCSFACLFMFGWLIVCARDAVVAVDCLFARSNIAS
jgi:hypothetical protein